MALEAHRGDSIHPSGLDFTLADVGSQGKEMQVHLEHNEMLRAAPLGAAQATDVILDHW